MAILRATVAWSDRRLTPLSLVPESSAGSGLPLRRRHDLPVSPELPLERGGDPAQRFGWPERFRVVAPSAAAGGRTLPLRCSAHKDSATRRRRLCVPVVNRTGHRGGRRVEPANPTSQRRGRAGRRGSKPKLSPRRTQRTRRIWGEHRPRGRTCEPHRSTQRAQRARRRPRGCRLSGGHLPPCMPPCSPRPPW